MFYNIAAAQDKFEILVFMVLMFNIFVFVTFTFMPQIYHKIASWATALVDRCLKCMSITRQPGSS